MKLLRLTARLLRVDECGLLFKGGDSNAVIKFIKSKIRNKTLTFKYLDVIIRKDV